MNRIVQWFRHLTGYEKLTLVAVAVAAIVMSARDSWTRWAAIKEKESILFAHGPSLSEEGKMAGAKIRITLAPSDAQQVPVGSNVQVTASVEVDDKEDEFHLRWILPKGLALAGGDTQVTVPPRAAQPFVSTIAVAITAPGSHRLVFEAYHRAVSANGSIGKHGAVEGVVLTGVVVGGSKAIAPSPPARESKSKNPVIIQ